MLQRYCRQITNGLRRDDGSVNIFSQNDVVRGNKQISPTNLYQVQLNQKKRDCHSFETASFYGMTQNYFTVINPISETIACPLGDKT